MQIRTETKEDHDTVNRLVELAFRSAEHTDGTEHKLVAALRVGDAFVPELSLVAEQEGEIVGYILFTENKIGGTTALTLAPLAVRPNCQRLGIGTALMQAGHRTARALGYPLVVVLGSEQYYPRNGYLPAERFGITAPFAVPSANFMVFALTAQANNVRGVVEYAKEFGI